MAASRKGVAPERPRTPRPAAPRLSRVFTSAPCSTSLSTKSRLLSFPEPIGAGSPLSSSPRLGLRTQVSVCSAGEPGSLVVRVGPASSRIDRQLEVAVLDGQDQAASSPRPGPARRPFRLHCLVDVGPRLQQHPHNLRPAFAHGEEQGCKSGRQRSPEIGPGLDQRSRQPPRALPPPPTSGPFVPAAPWH